MATYNVLILGASYGSLLAIKLLFGGHKIKLVCLPAEAEAINKEGARVRLPIKGRQQPIELDSRKLPGTLSAAGPGPSIPPTTIWSHWRCRSRSTGPRACASS